MNRIRWKIFKWIALGLFLAFFAGAAIVYFRPLGPPLDLVVPATQTAGERSKITAQTDPVTISEPTPTPDREIAAAVPAPDTSEVPRVHCGQTGRLNLLVLGQNPPERFPRGADAIRLISVDFDHATVQVAALPPKLWVETDALEDIEGATLTDTFGLAQKSFSLGDREGTVIAIRVLAQVLLDNFGFYTDRYLTIDQSSFKEMISAVGSIEIDVPKAIDGAPDGYGYYEAGLQEMDAQRALDYLRILKPAGQPSDEWARLKRQNQVLEGLQKELLNPENWDQIPKFVNEFYIFTITNLSVRELLNLNCMVSEAEGSISMVEIPPEFVSDGPGGALIPDKNAFRTLLTSFSENR